MVASWDIYGEGKNKTLPSSMGIIAIRIIPKGKRQRKGSKIKPMPDDMHGMYVFGGGVNVRAMGTYHHEGIICISPHILKHQNYSTIKSNGHYDHMWMGM